MIYETGAALAQRDYLMRVIRELSQTLAALTSGKRDEIAQLDLLEAILEQQRGLDVDPMVVQLIGRAALVRLAEAKGQLEPLGLLLWNEAGVRKELGEEAMAAKLRRRAITLLVAARDSRAPLSAESQAILDVV